MSATPVTSTIPTTRLSDSVELGGAVCERPGLIISQGRLANGQSVSVIALKGAHDDNDARTYQNIVRHGGLGGLTIEQADGETIVASPACSGTVAHLPALGWRLPRRLDVFKEIALLVQQYHQAGVAIGTLDPGYIMLDDDLHPFLLGPGVGPTMGLFTAPETSEHGRTDFLSDLYSLGRLLHFVIAQAEPEPQYDDPPRLEDLLTFPAGLSRIVRRATLKNGAARYNSVAQLLDDLAKYGRYEEVGLAHPDVEEKNLAGLSHIPPAATAVQVIKKRLSELPMAAPSLDDLSPFKLGTRTRIGLLVAGTTALIGALAMSWWAGDATSARMLTGLSAGLIGFAAINPGVDKEQTARTAMALFFGALVFALDLSPLIAQAGQRAGLRSGDSNKAAESFKALKDKGQVNYKSVNLSGADLSGQEFLFTTLDSVNFEKANLKGAEFINVTFKRVRFAGANLEGAMLSGANADGMIDLDKAICSPKTSLPLGWSCVNHRPQSDDAPPPSEEPEPTQEPQSADEPPAKP